MNSLHTSSRS